MFISPDALLFTSFSTLDSFFIVVLLWITSFSSKKKIKTPSQENQSLTKTKPIVPNKNNTKLEFNADINHPPLSLLSTDDTPQQITVALNNLFNELGYNEAYDFVTLCIQELTQRNEQLNQYILDKDWNSAKKMAHKLLGSSNLYASNQLQQILHHIDTDMLSGEKLKPEFMEVQNQLTLILYYMKKKLET